MAKLRERQKKKTRRWRQRTTARERWRNMPDCFLCVFRSLCLSLSLLLPPCAILADATWFDHRVVDDDKSLTVRSNPWLSRRLLTWSIVLSWVTIKGLFLLQVNRHDNVPDACWRSLIDGKQIISFHCLWLHESMNKHRVQSSRMTSQL